MNKMQEIIEKIKLLVNELDDAEISSEIISECSKSISQEAFSYYNICIMINYVMRKLYINKCISKDRYLDMSVHMSSLVDSIIESSVMETAEAKAAEAEAVKTAGTVKEPSVDSEK